MQSVDVDVNADDEDDNYDNEDNDDDAIADPVTLPLTRPQVKWVYAILLHCSVCVCELA